MACTLVTRPVSEWGGVSDAGGKRMVASVVMVSSEMALVRSTSSPHWWEVALVPGVGLV